MSSSRSIAAARQRRGVESAPPIKTNNYVSSNKDNNVQGRVNYRATNTNIYQDNQPVNMNNANTNNQISKLSVSDAFALVTIRLGRVELILNKLQSEGILDADNNINSEKINNGSGNFDDTILQNIITRLDGLDKKTVSNDLNQKLQSQYNNLQEELKQTKDMMMKMQSFILENSQKLTSFISNQELFNTNQEAINDELFDIRDDVTELTNKINSPAVESNDKLNESEVVDLGVDSDIITNESNINMALEHHEISDQSIVEPVIEQVDESLGEAVGENSIETASEITSEVVENASRKNKHNRNKSSMNLDV